MPVPPKPLSEEIAEQEYRLLQLVAGYTGPALTTLKEVVVALERIRHRAADLQTANDLRADLIARQRGLGDLPTAAHSAPEPREPLGH